MVYEKKKTDGKSSRGEFLKKVLALPHIEAIISDSFWYIICIFFKGPDKKYSEKKEMLRRALQKRYNEFVQQICAAANHIRLGHEIASALA